MATTTVPAPEEQPSISPIGRIFGAFFSPKATFEDIVRKPSWLLPILLLTVISVVVSFAFSQRVNWREFMSQQIEKSPRASQLSSEQKEQQINGGAKFTPIVINALGVVAPLLGTLIVGLILWGAYSLLGGISTNFSTAMAIAAHAFLTGLVSSPLLLLIIYLKPPEQIDVENPVATNLAAILPEDSTKWLVALCKSLDIFTIWTMILLAIGFAAVNPKKLKGAKSYAIVFSVWGAFVVVRVLWAFIFS
jgi:hypothetical protein